MSDHAPLPEFWVRKIRSFFVLFDRDLDGIVRKEDYLDWVLERTKSFLAKDKQEKYKEYWNAAWNEFWGGPEGKVSVTFEEMMQSHARTFRDPKFAETCKNWFNLTFDGADANSDEFITLQEYSDFLKCYGVHPLSVTPSFQALDTNHDGLISREDFTNAGRDYFVTTDDNPSKLFWGPFLC
ncbi:sarcoplasmic calcium-binding protein-like [Lingula anatina]|uniref:Sarcoplasmic calcium-binding protein-like n=1 Tax=Lingula anatina TaxID=7574 RepID=A0A1S3JDG9_LINAN|nr:sarcoplasmic calcium-binding protein-like [Lingula anatina]|eukprot:XP_013408452.1 sarcoplasmic calcium-binding protein-like [Lingula anatina]